MHVEVGSGMWGFVDVLLMIAENIERDGHCFITYLLLVCIPSLQKLKHMNGYLPDTSAIVLLELVQMAGVTGVEGMLLNSWPGGYSHQLNDSVLLLTHLRGEIRAAISPL